jgi:hypothetical protein
VEHLRQARFHAGSLAGGQDYGGKCSGHRAPQEKCFIISERVRQVKEFALKFQRFPFAMWVSLQYSDTILTADLPPCQTVA